MCIIFILYQVHPTYPLIIASNRDEMLDRPTESMKLRGSIDINPTMNDDDNTNCQQERRRRRRNHQQKRCYLAGRDLVCGGTWLALDVSSMTKVVDLINNDDDSSSIAHHGGDCTLDNIVSSSDKKDNDNSNNNINDNDDSTIPSLLRWIAITNYREKEEHGRPSRGELLTEYITQQTTTTHHQEEAKDQHSSQSSSSCCCYDAPSFLKKLQPNGQQYNGFNLLVGDDTGIYYYSNRSSVQDHDDDTHQSHDDDDDNAAHSSIPQRLMPGRIYGLSNALLDTPWPKVERGKELLEQLIHEEQQKIMMNSTSSSNSTNNNNNNNNSSLKQFHEKLQTILHDTIQPSNDNLLPNTGIGLYSERHLSSIFVPVDTFLGRDYGTRSSTSIVMDVVGRVSVLERSCWLSSSDDDEMEEKEQVVQDEWFYFRQGNDD